MWRPQEDAGCPSFPIMFYLTETKAASETSCLHFIHSAAVLGLQVHTTIPDCADVLGIFNSGAQACIVGA